MEVLKKVPKKVVFLLLVFAVLAIGAVFLFSSKPKTAEAAGSLNFTLIKNNTEYEVSGNSNSGEVVIPASYNGKPVTRIAMHAFLGCSELTSITIPNSVTSIGDWAFRHCSGLTSITIPNSVISIGDDAFYSCSGLEGLIVSAGNSIYKSDNSNCIIRKSGNVLILGCKNSVIPNYVTIIGKSAFEGCSSLASITIPNSIISIDNSAFRYCGGLTSITIPSSVTNIGDSAFEYCSGLESIIVAAGNSVYKSDSNCIIRISDNVLILGYKNSVIPNYVTTIGNSAFSSCSGLTSITIPNSVTTIGNSAFYSCSGLTSITIPNSAITIGNSAFYSCSRLTSIIIPDSVTSIGNSAFWGTGIWNNAENNNVVYAGKWAVGYKGTISDVSLKTDTVGIASYAFQNCGSLTSITIPNSIISIGDSAFYYCSGLTSVTIPESVTSIGYTAFFNCSKLESITLPFVGNTLNGTTNTHFGYIFGASSYSSNSSYVPTSLKTAVITGGNIRDYAFYNCTSLTSITIPSRVTSIGGSAFQNCCSLMSITIPSSVTSIGGDAFYNCTSFTNITLPFAGNTLNETVNTHFGYIFGASSYSSNSSYVPVSLKNSYDNRRQN